MPETLRSTFGIIREYTFSVDRADLSLVLIDTLIYVLLCVIVFISYTYLQQLFIETFRVPVLENCFHQMVV